MLGYRYRRFMVEQRGKVLRVCEVSVGLDYDVQFRLETDLDKVVRVRTRRLDPDEFRDLWRRFEKLGRAPASSRLMCVSGFGNGSADEGTVMEEDRAPASITVRWSDKPGSCADADGNSVSAGFPSLRRVVIDRIGDDPFGGDEDPAVPCSSGPEDDAVASLLEGLLVAIPERRRLNARRIDAVEALVDEFKRLKTMDFLNLKQFERVALRIFGYFGNPVALEVIGAELYASSTAVRMEALRALGEIGEVEPLLGDVSNMLYDDCEAVRREARAIVERANSKKRRRR